MVKWIWNLDNTISLGQLERAMRLGEWGEQIVLKSQKSFEQISFVKAHFANNKIYYQKRINRDKYAREAFYKIIEEIDAKGVFLHDLMQTGGDGHDACL